MYNKLIQFILFSTALAPIFLFNAYWMYLQSVVVTSGVFIWVVVSLLLGGVGFFVLKYGSRRLEGFSENIVAIKNCDGEVVAFLLAYLLPWIAGTSIFMEEWEQILGYLVPLIFVFWGSSCLYINPLLRIFGYHMYEITLASQVTCYFISKRILRGLPTSAVKVVRITEYVLLERQEIK